MRFKNIDEAIAEVDAATRYDQIASALKQVQKQRRSLLGPFEPRPSEQSPRMRFVRAMNAARNRIAAANEVA